MADIEQLKNMVEAKKDLEKRIKDLQCESLSFELEVVNELMKGNMIQFLSVNWPVMKRSCK